MRLQILSWYVPAFIKKRKLRELFQLTAAAFQAEIPNLGGLAYCELLQRYATFTQEQAESALQSGADLALIRQRLFTHAYQMGRNLKSSLGINTAEEVMQVSRIIYRILDIDFQGEADGSIVIRRCFFSRIYSSQTCRIISALDQGLLAGLSGGQLHFTQRITEGKDCCIGRLEMGSIEP